MSTEILDHIAKARRQIFDCIALLNVLSASWGASDLYQGERLLLNDVNRRLLAAGEAMDVARTVVLIEMECADPSDPLND